MYNTSRQHYHNRLLICTLCIRAVESTEPAHLYGLVGQLVRHVAGLQCLQARVVPPREVSRENQRQHVPVHHQGLAQRACFNRTHTSMNHKQKQTLGSRYARRETSSTSCHNLNQHFLGVQRHSLFVHPSRTQIVVRPRRLCRYQLMRRAQPPCITHTSIYADLERGGKYCCTANELPTRWWIWELFITAAPTL